MVTMFVVWVGRGYIIGLIFCVCFFIAWPLESLFAPVLGLSGTLTGDTSTLDPHFFLMAATAFALAAAASYPIGRHIFRHPASQILVNPADGKSYVVNLDTLYTIETRRWTFIFSTVFVIFLGFSIAGA